MDGDGRNAKPLEDPGVVYARRFGPANGASLPDETVVPHVVAEPEVAVRSGAAKRVRQSAAATATESSDAPTDTPAVEAPPLPSCPKCGGRMWDNRLSKRNPKAPDYKCRDRSCDGVIWPTKAGAANGSRAGNNDAPTGATLDSSPLGMSVDDIPF